MGLLPFGNCRTNYQQPAPAPNPDPTRWELIHKEQYRNAYVLVVRYLDCTNFEGVKVMVFVGQYTPRETMDPHFTDGEDSPLARFKPDTVGRICATLMARSL